MQYPSDMTADTSGSRLIGIDFVRGVALLGITFVNVTMFASSFEWMVQPALPEGASWLAAAFHWFSTTFCAGKFYPLYSLLFGVGVAMMIESARRRNASAGWMLARRFAMLALMGVLHLLLIWYGDILLLYAMVGMAMIPLARCSARTLAAVAGGCFTLGIFGTLIFVVLTLMGGQEASPTPDAVAPASAGSLMEILRTYQPGNTGFDPRLGEYERRVFAEGSFGQAVGLRFFLYLFTMAFSLLIVVPQVAACFCLGAALWKGGLFAGAMPRFERWIIGLGALVGLPAQLVVAWAMAKPEAPSLHAGAMLLVQVGGPFVSLLYLVVGLRVAARFRDAAWVRAVAGLGSMGLTGYLGVSFLMSLLMQHWGLGLFGSVPMEWWWALVPGVWLVLLAASVVWLTRFRTGPLEWAWKSFTRLEMLPLRRERSS